MGLLILCEVSGEDCSRLCGTSLPWECLACPTLEAEGCTCSLSHRTGCGWLETFFRVLGHIQGCLGLAVKELLSPHLYTLKHGLKEFSIIVIHKSRVGHLTTSSMIFYEKSPINTGMI